ncbi:MAG: GDP-mannose 4,6-dehydratase [Candidatus Omnitrophica bacterium]|nr:GDP-mannose 4,6-dehydratase [Candidatus Omnitrophota bacterium]
MMKTKKILITGVAGMIGSHLSDLLLEKGFKVVGMDDLSVGRLENIQHNLRDINFRFVKGSILDTKALESAARNVDTIVHLAASKKIGEAGDAFKTLIINADGTRNVLEAAKEKRLKVIYASTSDVYGVSKDIPFREDGDLVIGCPTAKRWSYAISKAYGEQMAFAYYKEFGVPIVVIRYFGGFSPRASFSASGGHIPLFIDAILNDKTIVIHGDGGQTRSMGYVSDLVDGTIRALANPDAIGEIFNIGNDEEVSVIDSAYMIHKIASTGKKIKIRFVPQKKIFGTYEDIKRRVPSLSKARKLLGYRPMVNLAEGIRITIEARRR